MTTKIVALTDALGNLVRFVLLPGQRFDTAGIPPLIEGIAFGALIADKAFDSNGIIAELNERGAKVVISQHPRRTKPLDIDREMYKWRHLIEVVCTQMTKAHPLAAGAERDDVADLDLAVGDQHAIDQQLDQLPLLGEVGAGQARLNAPTEVGRRGGPAGELGLPVDLGLQLAGLHVHGLQALF